MHVIQGRNPKEWERDFETPTVEFQGRSIAAILFDKDGTLFDFRKTWLPILLNGTREIAGGDEVLAKELVIAAGYDPDTDRFAADGPIAAGNPTDVASAWRTVLQRNGKPAPSEQTFAGAMDRASRSRGVATSVPVTDLHALFARLENAGLVLGLATSDSEESARASLARERIDEFVHFVTGYDSGIGPKPDPVVVHAFARSANTNASSVLVAGDTWHDILMAREAGALSVAVLTGAVSHEELVPYADIVVDSIAELPELLGIER